MTSGGWRPLRSGVRVLVDGTLGAAGCPSAEELAASVTPEGGAAPGGYVYRIRSEATEDEAIGGTDRVLYLGTAGANGSLNRRVLGLWTGGHSAVRSLYRMNVARHRARRELIVAVDVRPETEPELAEVLKLHRFSLLLGHLPVLNRRWEGFLAGRALELLIERAGLGSAPVPAYNLVGAESTPSEPTMGPRTGVATICHAAGDPWRGSLLWVWPDAWTGAHRGDWSGRLFWLAPGSMGTEPALILPEIKWLPEARVAASWEAASLAADGDDASVRRGLETLFAQVPQVVGGRS
jgi:hypothetical protein